MWDNKPPPLMVILLWQHFCYYKRHKVLLVISVLLPFILLGFLAILLWQFTGGAFSKPYYYSITRQQTVSLLSSGPLQYVEGSYNCYQNYSQPKYPDTDKYDSPNNEFYSTYSNDRSILDFQTNQQNHTICTQEVFARPENFSCMQFFENFYYHPNYKYDPTVSLLLGYILYYPNTSVVGLNVTNEIKKLLDTYTFLQNTAEVNQSVDVLPFWAGLNAYSNLSTECWKNVETRIVGFQTLGDLLQFTQNNLSKGSYDKSLPADLLLPELWGAISFDESDEALKSKQFKYSILYESGYSTVDRRDIWLQDLVERSAVKIITNSEKLPITPTIKELPTKCWIRPPPFIYTMLQSWLPLMITIGFFLMPTTFLILIVQEKMLKLREYLYIMGVTDLVLKLSWMLFFLMFLIPMAIVTCIVVYFLPGGVFSNSDPSVLFVICIIYTLSQLCWVYLLSTVMQTPTRAGFIVGFFNIFFSAFSYSIYIFGHGELTGSFLIIGRILSLHTSVPFSLAMCYYVGWEAIWTGSQWRYFFAAPTVGDGYGGFGECILWMIGDSFLYLFLAWYFQHLFPGEYGVKYPFYFIFQPSFWCPKSFGEKKEMIKTEESQADIELFGQNREAGITLELLTKYYGKDKVGIEKLSVNFFKNEITAFLGENGAGKTTTMNILVGLINPTDGNAWIQGLNVSKRMPEIRKLLAFVPQYDILYPSMTVEEHIQFFGWLQNLSKNQIWESMDSLLKSFDLLAQKKTLTTNLSGGQKRKLSILTAYIRKPEIIILDEPTSGVDPYSRKSIWEIISQHRKNATTILSTHYMQEADLLGDRIAIISSGKLQCVGSSMYLKNRYGQGYHLTLAQNSRYDSDRQLDKFLKDRIPQVKLIQESGNDKTYTVPIEIAQSDQMINLLQDIEKQQEKLGILSFGVTEPSMEEVFFAATGARHKIVTDEIPNNPRTMSISSYASVAPASHGTSSVLTQFATLFMKRVLLTFRSPSVFVLQVLLPLILVGIMLLIDHGFNSISSPTVVNFYAPYRQNVLFFQDNGGMGNEFLNAAAQYGLNPQKIGSSKTTLSYPPNTGLKFNTDCSCNSYCLAEDSLKYSSTVIPSNDVIYPLDSAANVSDWVLHANQSNHWVIGGFEFFQMSPTVYEYNNAVNKNFQLANSILNDTTVLNYSVIWTSEQQNQAMLNAFNNLLLRQLQPEWSIVLTRKPADLIPPSSNIISQISSMISSIMSCYFLIMAYVFATFGIANIVQAERQKGLKRLQFIVGANPVSYWLANLVWDLIQFTFTAALTFVLLAIVSNPFYNNNFNDLGILALILMPFAVGSMSFTYLMSFIISSPQALNRTISLVGFVALIIGATLSMFSVFNDLDEGDFSWITYVSSVFCLFPYYYIAESVSYITFGQSNVLALPSPDQFSDLLAFDRLGRRIMEGWISSIILFLAVILIEYSTYRISGSKGSSAVSQNFRQMMDADVIAEEQNVLTQTKLDQPLVVRQVTKVYPKQVIPAVNGVSFSIPRGQCFGLLGINGAGKTSLFRILAGFAGPTSGSAFIEGLDIRENFRTVGEKMGYCPQDNTLFDQLTPKEHLQLVGRLRGIPKKQLDDEIDRMMLQVGLDAQQKKQASQLSGGNQRKLQFAMALLDYRPIIFLDEPTTGMDPSARRLAWNSIMDAVARGCSIVLTSHSMEECEVLCHRLVIMVLGNFSCIGSVQYLKGKFGNKYTFKVKMSSSHGLQEPIQLKEYIYQHLPGAVLIEEHSTLLVYEISADGLLISQLFQLLCNSKKQFPSLVEDFTTSQVSLEHVFVSMAERQQLLQAGVPVTVTV